MPFGALFLITMGVLISSSDFVGKYAIARGGNTELDAFINDTEEDYLASLLGADFYTDFKADLDVNKVPQTQKYKNIYLSFKKDYNRKVVISKGMKEMLVGLIFFDFVRQIRFKATQQGVATNSSDTATNVDYGDLYKFLNDATDTFNAIQQYILLINPSDYQGDNLPEFNGSWKDYSIPMFL